MHKGYLTTHVLDTAQGIPAQGIKIIAYSIKNNAKTQKITTTTNNDGRTNNPIIPQGEFNQGEYLLEFYAGDYIRKNFPQIKNPFFEIIPINFINNDENAHYHVPLLLAPFGYSTYRGS